MTVITEFGYRLLLLLLLFEEFTNSLELAVKWRSKSCKLEAKNCVCSGTSNSRSAPGHNDSREKWMQLRDHYENCTRIYGNVEIVEYNGTEPLDFFDSIVEIKGYLLIYDVVVPRISFKSLQMIWGDSLHDTKYAVQVQLSSIEEIAMPNLRSIHNGKVLVQESYPLCHWKNFIRWEEFSTDPQPVKIITNQTIDKCDPLLVPCEPSCAQNCWGNGKEDCQIVHLDQCSHCYSGHCYMDTLRNQSRCCHDQCAGGCTGDTDRDCLFCKNLEQDGRCVEQCTRLYKMENYARVPNPDGFYTYGRYCVKECPAETLVEEDGCVIHCDSAHFHDASTDSRQCKLCMGECPKSCKLNEPITYSNLQRLHNCTEIDGFIKLNRHIFSPQKKANKKTRQVDIIPAVTENDLNILRSVRQVSQYVEVAGTPIKGLSFLENVEIIEGRKLSSEKFALIVSSNDNIQELALRNLKKIKKGDVLVTTNHFLCYVSNNTFEGVVTGNYSAKVMESFDDANCKKRNRVCDANCDPSAGCWGKGPKMCRKCEKWSKNGECVDKCPEKGFRPVASTLTCEPCAEECLTCSGPSSFECSLCRRVSMVHSNQSIQCIPFCPDDHYEEKSTRQCKKCHKSCYDNGCTGPEDLHGDNGCNNCTYSIVQGRVERCLFIEDHKRKDAVCSMNGYPNYYLLPEQGIERCHQCSSQCLTCSTSGNSVVESKCECRNYTLKDRSGEEFCVDDCKDDSFPVNGTFCHKCHELCDPSHGCAGPLDTNCNQCRYAELSEGEERKCFAQCPEGAPYREQHTKRCHAWDVERIHYWKKVALAVGSIVLVIVVSALIYRCNRYKNELENEKVINGPNLPEMGPIDPLARPNMNRLNVISTDELTRLGRKLGEGAFGVVYAGYYKKWNKKLPVAIKVIKNCGGDEKEKVVQEQKEMMDEATKMGLMNHRHLLRLVGICFSDDTIQLITVLRPLGNLLKYLQDKKQYLVGRDLLIYCYQIASAMKYLYDHRLVHRDLAARNVLVKQHNFVEVTDFGLSKLIEDGDTEVKVKSGRVPYRWLAPECFDKYTYTHATDVWAYGVTCWEILTYGQSPYQGMDHHTVRDYISSGKRLEQPNNCTLELASTLLQCWMGNPDSRPTFVTLEETFTKYCKTPHLYVPDTQLHRHMSSEPCQRELLQELLQESDGGDFQDPLEYDDFLNQPAPVSGGGRVSRMTSTNSQRYQMEPMDRMERLAVKMQAEEQGNEVHMDDNNYLVPNTKGGADPAGILYTTVVTENGNSELISEGYYNEAVPGGDYYNEVGATKKLLPTIEENSNGSVREMESVL